MSWDGERFNYAIDPSPVVRSRAFFDLNHLSDEDWERENGLSLALNSPKWYVGGIGFPRVRLEMALMRDFDQGPVGARYRCLAPWGWGQEGKVRVREEVSWLSLIHHDNPAYRLLVELSPGERARRENLVCQAVIGGVSPVILESREPSLRSGFWVFDSWEFSELLGEGELSQPTPLHLKRPLETLRSSSFRVGYPQSL